MFVLAFTVYSFVMRLPYFFLGLVHINFMFNSEFLLGIIYNLSVALIIFCLADIFINPKSSENRSRFL
jgi:hypothetical protein